MSVVPVENALITTKVTYIQFEDAILDAQTVKGGLCLLAVRAVRLGEDHHIVFFDGIGSEGFGGGRHCGQTLDTSFIND